MLGDAPRYCRFPSSEVVPVGCNSGVCGNELERNLSAMSAVGTPDMPASPRGASGGGKVSRKRGETVSPFSPRGEAPQKTHWQPTRFTWFGGSPTPPTTPERSPEKSPKKLGKKLSPWKRLVAGVRSPFGQRDASQAPASASDESLSKKENHPPVSSSRRSLSLPSDGGADSISSYDDDDADDAQLMQEQSRLAGGSSSVCS